MALLREHGPEHPDYERGLRAAIDSGDLDPQMEALARFELGYALNLVARQEDTVPVLEGAVGLSSDAGLNGQIHHELGEAYNILGDPAAAERNYRASLEHSREHPFAPDTMCFLAKLLYGRAHADTEHFGQFIQEAYALASEAMAIYESPTAENFTTYASYAKSLADAQMLSACCLSEMAGANEQFEADAIFRRMEQHCLEHRDEFASVELEGMYENWLALLVRMEQHREAKLVHDRWKRNVPG